jgi:hypothetical protein
MSTRICLIAIVTFLSGCGGSKPPEPPQFELRDFAVTEQRTEATQYSKEWNSFKGTGTLVARNVDKDRNLIVLLEIRDDTKGPSAEPEIGSILLQGGVGKIEIVKSKYAEMSPPPKYNWKVIGWYELQKASIEVPGQAAK